MSDFIASLDSPLGIPKPNTLALVSFDLPIAKGDKIHCLDVLHSLTKYTLGFVDDGSEDFSKVSQRAGGSVSSLALFSVAVIESLTGCCLLLLCHQEEYR